MKKALTKMINGEEDVIIIYWDDEIFKRANERAQKKAKWMDTWKNRDEEQRRKDFLDGQLGEEGFRKFLEDNKIPYIYYDDVRTDDFKNKDEFDFMMMDANKKEIEVSVKSSKLKKSIEETIAQNKILAYPGQIKPITVQPFIDYENNRIILAGWETKEFLESIPPKELPGSFSDKPVKYHQQPIYKARKMTELPIFLGFVKKQNTLPDFF